MIFFCFSSKDRHSIVESIFYHVTNYALPVWYDRHKMLLGDSRDYKNFIEGVGQSNYAVIILSPNAIESPCACEEIDLIFERYKKDEMYVFPIFYNIKPHQLGERFHWMTELVYKELDDRTDSLSTSNHIVCRVLLDELSKCRIKTIDDFLNHFGDHPIYTYICGLTKSYKSVSDKNHNAKIALLYAGCQFIKSHYNIKSVPPYYYVGADRLFNETRLDLPIDLREILILERLFLLLINSAIFGYTI